MNAVKATLPSRNSASLSGSNRRRAKSLVHVTNTRDSDPDGEYSRMPSLTET